MYVKAAKQCCNDKANNKQNYVSENLGKFGIKDNCSSVDQTIYVVTPEQIGLK